MKRVILFAIILVLAMATVSWAEPLTGVHRITYGGYVEKYPDGTVDADTLITVFNPNNVAVGTAQNPVGITVYDKYGRKVIDSKLLNGGNPITTLPVKGWGWQTIGNLIPSPELPHATKYTFIVWWTKPAVTPYRQLVIEIKEIVYTEPVYPTEGPWMPMLIKFWSEAAVGKVLVTP